MLEDNLTGNVSHPFNKTTVIAFLLESMISPAKCVYTGVGGFKFSGKAIG